MHEKARQLIKKRIEKILDEYSFKRRSKEHKSECPCYSKEPCHKMPEGEELNCFLCFCPEYSTEKEEGGCKIGRESKWYFHPSLPNGKVWDCNDCTYPHLRSTARKYLEGLFGIS